MSIDLPPESQPERLISLKCNTFFLFDKANQEKTKKAPKRAGCGSFLAFSARKPFLCGDSELIGRRQITVSTRCRKTMSDNFGTIPAAGDVFHGKTSRFEEYTSPEYYQLATRRQLVCTGFAST
jgi:hypothetical protein